MNNLTRFKSFASSQIGSPDLAAEVVQESLYKAVANIEKLEDETKIIPWFFQILKSTLIDLHRKTKTDRNRETAWAQGQVWPDIHEEACRCLNSLIQTLKPEYAEVIQALDLQELPHQELAAKLEISPVNLRVRHHRARAQLKKRLEDTCHLCAKHGCLNCSCPDPEDHRSNAS